MADEAIKTESFLEGYVIFRQGDIAKNCFILRSGEIELSRVDKDGNEVKFATVTKGEILGEMSMILDMPRTATATTTQKTEVAEITRDEFHVQIERLNPFMRRLIKLIVQRLRDTTSDLTRG